MVLAAGQAALVVAVRAETAAGRGRALSSRGRAGRRVFTKRYQMLANVAHLETREKASTHTAGQGTIRTAMRPSAAG